MQQLDYKTDLHRVVIEREPQRAQKPCISATGNCNELKIILSMDYKVPGKCTYAHKNLDIVHNAPTLV